MFSFCFCVFFLSFLILECKIENENVKIWKRCLETSVICPSRDPIQLMKLQQLVRILLLV